MQKRLLVLLCSLIALSSCAVAAIGAGATGAAVATDSRGFSNVMADKKIEYNVNNVLSAQIPNGSFTVASFNAGVLLAGQVPTENDIAKAVLAVKNTAGVRQVYNYLSVKDKENLLDISNDAYLTSAAKLRLIGQKDVNTNNIKVVTCNKVVYLLGHDAGRASQLKAAIYGIGQIDGVKSVIDLIN